MKYKVTVSKNSSILFTKFHSGEYIKKDYPDKDFVCYFFHKTGDLFSLEECVKIRKYLYDHYDMRANDIEFLSEDDLLVKEIIE